MSRLDNGYTDTLRDVQKVFRHCVILKAGVPVYIHEADEDGSGVKNLLYSELPLMYAGGDDIKRAPISDEDWAISPMRLGYVNNLVTDDNTTSCGYCVRSPYRRVQQGLHEQNVSLPLQNPTPLRAKYSFTTLIYKTGFGESLTNTYPSVSHALRAVVSGDAEGMAFSRRWAVRVDPRLGVLYLEYRGRRMATSLDKGHVFVIPKDFEYLVDEFNRTVKGQDHNVRLQIQ